MRHARNRSEVRKVIRQHLKLVRNEPDRDAHDRAQRDRIQSRLNRLGFPMIRLQSCRATLEQPFACARYGETIVTFRHEQAHYIKLDALEEVVSTLAKEKTDRAPDYAWQYIFNRAKRWAKERAPIRHATWGK